MLRFAVTLFAVLAMAMPGVHAMLAAGAGTDPDSTSGRLQVSDSAVAEGLLEVLGEPKRRLRALLPDLTPARRWLLHAGKTFCIMPCICLSYA